MIRKTGLTFMLIVLLGVIYLPQINAEVSDDWTDSVMIAHAMGGIEGQAYTNSYDAFVENYKNGYRVFETDLNLTEDGKLVAIHDWADELQPDVPDELQGDALRLAEFKASPILGEYKPLTFREIVKLLQRYPDIFIVTDTKAMDPAVVKQQFEYMKAAAQAVDLKLLDRVIPEIYTPAMYETVMSIYPFPQKLYSLYQAEPDTANVVQFVQDKGIETVTMPVYRALFDPILVWKLNQQGVKTYVHAVNNKLEMGLLLLLGVYGVYSDFISDPLSIDVAALKREVALDLALITASLVLAGMIVRAVHRIRLPKRLNLHGRH